jgi:DNA polymerase-3 subunit epsilon
MLQHQWDEKHICTICGIASYSRHVQHRTSECPGVRVLAYGEKWPEGLATQTQIKRDHNRRLAHNQPAIVAYVISDPPYYRYLYSIAESLPKREISSEQKAALERGRITQKTCKLCHTITPHRLSSQRVCYECSEALRFYQEAEWARSLMKKPTRTWCILDTETTSLEGEAIEIAIIDKKGKSLFHSLIKPFGPIDPEAQYIHGITDEELATAPTFTEIYEQIATIITNRTVVIYNRNFDTGILAGDCHRAGKPNLFEKAKKVTCAMKAYSKYVGEWSDYWHNYKWQQLPYGGHRALSDCLGTLRVIQEMAATPTLEEDINERKKA